MNAADLDKFGQRAIPRIRREVREYCGQSLFKFQWQDRKPFLL